VDTKEATEIATKVAEKIAPKNPRWRRGENQRKWIHAPIPGRAEECTRKRRFALWDICSQLPGLSGSAFRRYTAKFDYGVAKIDVVWAGARAREVLTEGVPPPT